MSARLNPDISTSASLPERLRQATRSLHTEVERTGVMRHLLTGHLNRAGYAGLLRNLATIYATMEPLLAAHRDHPWLLGVVDDALFRSAALDADLRALADIGDTPALAPSTHRYRLHLQQTGMRSPGLLVAHAYVRYLGDLSGGQVVRRIVAESLGLSGSAGLCFYDFGDTARTNALAQRFRQGLAAIVATASEQATLCDEARLAFTFHRSLFEELDPGRQQVTVGTPS